jgi:hypothetical protein
MYLSSFTVFVTLLVGLLPFPPLLSGAGPYAILIRSCGSRSAWSRIRRCLCASFHALLKLLIAAGSHSSDLMTQPADRGGYGSSNALGQVRGCGEMDARVERRSDGAERWTGTADPSGV